MIPFVPSKENGKLQGIIASIDASTRKCASIKRFSI
jgi:hypothetical protein